MPDEARACSAMMSKWIDANRRTKPARGRKAPARNGCAPAAKGNDGAGEKCRAERDSGSPDEEAAQSGAAPTDPETRTPLRIPYGNKETAIALGARYGGHGWYAPPRCRPHRIPRA